MTNKEAIEILNKGYPDINEYAASEYEQYYDDVRDYDEALNHVIKALEEQPQGDLIRREALKDYARKVMNDKDALTIMHLELFDNIIDNAPTVELNSEYGAIQYSNGFNDGFTAAKDTIIQNIAKQYIEHNELVPSWLSIGDIKGGAENATDR